MPPDQPGWGIFPWGRYRARTASTPPRKLRFGSTPASEREAKLLDPDPQEEYIIQPHEAGSTVSRTLTYKSERGNTVSKQNVTSISISLAQTPKGRNSHSNSLPFLRALWKRKKDPFVNAEGCFSCALLRSRKYFRPRKRTKANLPTYLITEKCHLRRIF